MVKGRGTRKIICPLKEGAAGPTEYRTTFGFSGGSSFRFNSPDRRGFSGEDIAAAASASSASARTPSYGSGTHFNSTLDSSRPYFGGGGGAGARHYE